jgi:hypothetical protein
MWDRVYGGIGQEVGADNGYNYNFMVLADKNDDFVIAGITKVETG